MTIRSFPVGIAPSAYLESLRQNDRFKDCRELYTSTQARIPLQVQSRKEPQKQRPGDPDSQQPEPSREPPVEVLEGLQDAVNAHRQVLLIGKPGSGKTTALRRLVWEGVSAWAHGAVDDQDSPIPVFVELRGRDGKSAKAVLEWIQDALEMHDQDISPDEIKQLLKQDQLLLLFDGVNEASADNVSALDAFRERYPKTPMIFTTRELGAGQSLGIEKKLEIVPLTVSQMRDFIQKRLPGQAETLLKQMGDRLRELAETPMLLNMFCEVYKPEQPILQNRGELFRQFAQLYDEKHKRRCQYEGIVYPDFYDFRDEVLQQLAFEMMQGHEKPEGLLLQIKRTDAEKLIERVFHQRGVADAPTKVKKWLDGLVRFHLLQVASHPNQIEFHHQLFQEYYAAEALLPKLPTLTDDQLKCHYLNYLKWTESLAMALSLIDKEGQNQALRIVKLALETDRVLGAELAGAANSKFRAATINQVINQEIPNPLKIDLLGHTRSPEVIPLLLEALKDSNHIIRLSAVMGLGKIANREATQSLLQALKDSASIVARRAVRILSELDHEAVIPDLLMLLKDQNVEFRQRATSTLSQLNDSKVIPDLLSSLEDPEAKVRLSAIKALVRLNDRTTVPNLLSLASQDSDSDVRSSAIKALAYLGDENVIPDLVLMLQDPDSWVRQSVAEALGELGGYTAIPSLLKALRDSDFAVRESAAKSLGKLGDSTAIPDLVKTLKNLNLYIRRNAAKLLGLLGSNTAIPGLLLALDDLDPYVRQNAVKSLGQIGKGDKKAISGLLNALEDLNPDVSSGAAEALGTLNSQEAIPALTRIFRDKGSNVRLGMLKALARINSKEAIQVLLEALEDSDFNVQLSAIECAERLPAEQAIPKLREILKVSDSYNFYIRSSAVEALGRIGKEFVIQDLLKSLQDSDFMVRESAVKTLGMLSDYLIDQGVVEIQTLDRESHEAARQTNRDAVILGLLGALEDQSYHVCWLAAWALGQVGSSKEIKTLWDVQLKYPEDKMPREAIAAIQARCGFYNSDLYQQAQTLEMQSGDAKQQSSSEIHMHFHDKVDVAVGNVEGDLNYRQPPTLDETQKLEGQ